jgi:tetratricopeptide (TPR) repeat protein
VEAREADRVARFLAELVGVPFEASDGLLASARGDRVRMGDQIRAAWHDLLAGELAVSPVTIVLDDLHHADAASIELLGASLRRHADRPLAVLGFFGRGASLPSWPRTIEASLGPLDGASAAELASSLLPGRGADAVVDRIVRQAEGIPLAIEELAVAEIEGRAHRTPPTLLALAQARLGALDDESRRLLRAGSVFRGDFAPEALAALVEADAPPDVVERLESLVDEGILVRSSRGAAQARYTFVSSMVRDAAYAMLTDDDRALGHLLAAGYFAATAGPREAPIVAYHYEAAGDRRKSAIWFARAAELALEGNEFARAAELASRGAMAGASGALLGHVRVVETEANRHAGRNAQMLESALAALDHLPPDGASWWTAYADAVLGAIRLGEKQRLGDLARMPATCALSSLPAAGARAAHYLMFAGLREPAAALLGAVSLEGSAGDPAQWAWACRARATEALLQGDIGRYLEQLEGAVRSFAASGDVRELTLERANVGFARVELGLYEEAEEVLRASIASAEQLGLAHTAAVGCQNLGSALARQGRSAEGLEMLEGALERFIEQKNARMRGNTCTALSRVLLARGDAAGALARAREAIDALALVPPLLPGAMASVALALAASGDAEAALAHAREASHKLEAVGQIDEGEALVRLAFAEALERAGLHAEACDAIRAARARLLERARRLPHEAWRTSFLGRVAENRRTLMLAKAWLGDDP